MPAPCHLKSQRPRVQWPSLKDDSTSSSCVPSCCERVNDLTIWPPKGTKRAAAADRGLLLAGMKAGAPRRGAGYSRSFPRGKMIRMPVTHDSKEFKTPEEWDEWLARSGLAGKSLVNDHFVSNGAKMILDIREICSPVRNPGVICFEEDKMLRILKGIASNESIPPIQVDCPPQGPLPYRVRDGFHRYYASVLLGFRRVPVEIVDYLGF